MVDLTERGLNEVYFFIRRGGCAGYYRTHITYELCRSQSTIPRRVQVAGAPSVRTTTSVFETVPHTLINTETTTTTTVKVFRREHIHAGGID